ncbi:hypothetical protein [Serratia rhizosphaerae]|uniref:Fimbrial assembly protein (PilN) n=1 Tax=Serratia rhizosphaerae TaxID=2597702 RepID=A0ABX6GMI0_9GAMM|nr:hypothetical protein [Serratia rhizosphaerae]QHA87498.1 hypothetical protein FO014_11355 [Serratia rhizosphaerae]
MSRPLPDGLILWLQRPGWQLLALQWLLLGILLVLPGLGLIRGEWRQLERLSDDARQQAQRVGQLQRRLASLSPLARLEQQIAQQREQWPTEPELSAVLQRAGVRLLRWQRQEQPAQQRLRLRSDYFSLLQLLESLPGTVRISQLSLEMQPEGLSAEWLLQ